MPQLFSALTGLGAGLLLAGLIGAQPAAGGVGYDGDPRFRIADSGYAGSRTIRPQMVWLDNDRLLFRSQGLRKDQIWGAEAPPNWEPPPWALYIWDLRSGRIDKHVTLGESGSIACSRGPFVRYGFLGENGGAIRRWGIIGAEQETVVSAEERKLQTQTVQPIPCDYYPPLGNGVPGAPDKSYEPLWPEHGLLGWAYVGEKKSQMAYLAPGANAPVILPIADPVRVSRYSEYAQAYVLTHAPSHRIHGQDSTQALWLFRPPQHVERVEIPAGPWQPLLTHDHAPTRRGWFFRSNASGRRSQWDLGGAGAPAK